ncbi:hypothetical protein LCGC14_2637270 [marine sediment metagenome]|uniref:Uncharacterized protein n=1 Tax=marine sediment metagenome TaxID=412755 RepID=A0A0F9C9F2_9ZZZZ
MNKILKRLGNKVVVNGILHQKNSKGELVAFSIQELTMLFLIMRDLYRNELEHRTELESHFEHMRTAWAEGIR